MSHKSTVTKLILCFFACDLLLVLLYLANHALGCPSWHITVLLDLSGEANLPAWYASAQLLLISLLWAGLAATELERANRRSWCLPLIAAVFALLSLDEIAQIHELIGKLSDALLPDGQRQNTIFSRTGIWMFVLGIPFSLLMLAMLLGLKPYFHGRRPALKKFVLGLVLFLGSAAGIEVIDNLIPAGWRLLHLLQVCCEETGEMLGATILLWATADLLLSHVTVSRAAPIPSTPFKTDTKTPPRPRRARTELPAPTPQPTASTRTPHPLVPRP